MSLHLAAQHIAAKGRGPDDTLVHMSKDEVKSLEAIARANGGSLSVNPETGLVEAGFLESILPMVAGVALNAAFPGLGALGSAALVGGGSALATGDLNKGLMAGLGAYGGANMGSALAEQGMQQATQEQLAAGAQAGMAGPPTPEAINAARTAAAPTDFAGRLNAMGQGVQSLGQPGAISNVYQGLGGTGAKFATAAGLATPFMPQDEGPPEMKGSGPNPYQYSFNPGRVGPTPAPDVPGYGHQNQNFGRERLYFDPSFTRLADGGITGKGELNLNIPLDLGGAGAGLGGGLGGGLAGLLGGGGQGNSYPFGAAQPPAQMPTQMPSPPTVEQQTKDTRPIYPGPDLTGLTGGPFPPLGGWRGSPNPFWDSMQERNNPTNDVVPGPVQGMASGGTAGYNLGGYSDGGRLLRGPGDGVSDSIPATIGNRQPARLADGEFVVPARIVSELGNGSTEAGARKLYAMMDRVQKARGKTIGKNKIAANSKADKHLPA